MMLSLKFSVVFAKKSEAEEKISTLGSQATQYRSENNLHAAILCLEEMWELIYKSKSYWAQSLVRLPKFLQQAGRFHDAEKRFQELIALAPIAAQESGKDHDLSEFYIPSLEHHFLYDVYDAMRIVYKREKQIEQSNKYKMLAQEHLAIAQGFSKKLQAARFKQLEEHRAWCEEMQSLADEDKKSP